MSLPLEAQLFPRGRKDTGPKPKNIHGAVQDARGKAIVGARVYVRDMKTNVVRTLTTDQEGLYKVYALPPTADYEVYAELKGKASEKKVHQNRATLAVARKLVAYLLAADRAFFASQPSARA